MSWGAPLAAAPSPCTHPPAGLSLAWEHVSGSRILKRRVQLTSNTTHSSPVKSKPDALLRLQGLGLELYYSVNIFLEGALMIY